MKKRINFIDILFSNEGHYIDDIVKYTYLSKEYELHYFVNGKIDESHKRRLNQFIIHDFNCSKTTIGQVQYFMNIKKYLNKNDFNFIMSCTYIPLFIFSILSNYYSYYLLIHFFPTVKTRTYTFILNYLLNKVNSFIVLDIFVKDDILNKLNSTKKMNILVSHSRDIMKSEQKIHENHKIKVSFIGAMNQNKNVDILLNLLKVNYYENVEFGFYSKGIKTYLSDLETLNSLNVIDEYFSELEYTNYLDEADFVFLSYSDDYGIRFSGMLCDALSHGCQLICNENITFKYYIENYNCGYIFRDQDELHKILTNLQKLSINEEIYDDYSQQTREQLFLNIVENFMETKWI